MNKSPHIKKKLIPCNLCGSQDFQDLYEDELGNTPPLVDYNFNQDTRKTFKIVKCRDCGLIFTNPMPDMKSLYTETKDETYLNSEKQRHYTAKNAVNTITKYKKTGKLLDIGCSTGIFLDAAQKKFQVEGIELSEWASTIASQKHTVYQKPLHELDFHNKYDVITLWGVIEHFENPHAELKTIYKALAPGGIFVIYTGDIDAWLPRILGKKWWWFQGMHLYYFSKSTLSQMLENVGFKVLETFNYKLYFQLFSLAISLQRYKLSRFITPILNISFLRNIKVPIKISGEMVIIAKK